MTPDTDVKQIDFFKLVEKRQNVDVPFLLTRESFISGGGLLKTAKIVRENFVPAVKQSEIEVLDKVSAWVAIGKHFDLVLNPELRHKNWDNWDLPGSVYLNENTAMYLRTGILKEVNPKCQLLVAPETETGDLKLDIFNVLSETFIMLKTRGYRDVSNEKKESTTRNLMHVCRLVGGVNLDPVDRVVAVDVLTADFVRKYYARLLSREQNLLKH